MAEVKATAIARKLKKSAGEQTFCQRKGKTIAKMKIDENKSKTPSQQKQRARWRRLSNLELLFDTVSSISFPSRPKNLSYHNAFMQANLDAVSVNDELETTVDYARILCAKGRLTVPHTTVEYDPETRQLTFTHKAESNGRMKEVSDMLYAVVVEKEQKETEVVELNRRSENDPVSFTLPEEWSKEELEVYVFVLSANGRKASDSKHLTLA